jgi:uncharacterized RDD family membrane protein YckC
MRPPRYAGFWIRLVAHLIDTALVTGSSYLADLLAERVFDPESLLYQAVSTSVALGIAIPYYVWAQYRFGATAGKWLCGVRVVQYPGGQPLRLAQAWRRFFGYLISYLPYGTGYLMVMFHPEKRGLHDLIAGTMSVIERKER